MAGDKLRSHVAKETTLNFWPGVEALMASGCDQLVCGKFVEGKNAVGNFGIYAKELVVSEQQCRLSGCGDALAAHDDIGGVRFPLPKTAVIEVIIP